MTETRTTPTPSPRKYVPETEDLNKEFFEACARGTIHLQRCDSCGEFRHPPRYYCRHCFSDQYSWQPVTGLGTIASWVTSHFTVDRGWVDELPYTSIVVQLNEGPRLLGAMRNMTEHELALGLPVMMTGETKREDFVFFWVEPA